MYFTARSKWSLIGTSKFNKIQNLHAIHTVNKHHNLEIIIIFISFRGFGEASLLIFVNLSLHQPQF